MATIDNILGWFMSGDGRLVAAAVLFTLIWALKRLPWVGPWLDADSSVLTSKRKKLFANVVAAMAPVGFMLTTDAPAREVLVAAVEIMLMAAGVQSKQKAALSPKKRQE